MVINDSLVICVSNGSLHEENMQELQQIVSTIACLHKLFNMSSTLACQHNFYSYTLFLQTYNSTRVCLFCSSCKLSKKVARLNRVNHSCTTNKQWRNRWTPFFPLKANNKSHQHKSCIIFVCHAIQRSVNCSYILYLCNFPFCVM